MLAKAVPEVPPADSVPGGLAYEPKWDGFRVLVIRDGDRLELSSRNGKSLSRYFPELVATLPAYLPDVVVLDGEIIVRVGKPGSQRLDWDALSQRIHPADSRVATLAERTPAEVVAFDLLALGDEDLTGQPFSARRARLEELMAPVPSDAPLHLTAVTYDEQVARRWFTTFEGAGLDGVVAKPLRAPYQPDKRAMLKVKHRRTAEAVVMGYRVHKQGHGVGSLLLGLYDGGGHLRGVGGISAFTAKRRDELVDELAPLVLRDDDGEVMAAQRERNRFSARDNTAYVPLRPERVVEVAFDQLEGDRFRHAVTFLRWRPDRDPRSATVEQVERAPSYDLGEVLSEGPASLAT